MDNEDIPEGYDIIGDIHGHGEELLALLEKLDYFHDGVSYLHENRQALFLGDFVDRGPDSRGVIDFILDLPAELDVSSALEAYAEGEETDTPVKRLFDLLAECLNQGVLPESFVAAEMKAGRLRRDAFKMLERSGYSRGRPSRKCDEGGLLAEFGIDQTL